MLVVRHKHERIITVSSQNTMWEWGICEATAQLREWAEPSMRKENMSPNFKPIHAWDFKTQNWNVLAAQGHGGIPPDRAQPALHCKAFCSLYTSTPHIFTLPAQAVTAQCEHT